MSRETRSYDEETKRQLVAAWKAGASLSQLAAEFGIPKSTFRGWLDGEARTTVAPKKERASAPLEGEVVKAAEVPAPRAYPEQPEPETIDDIAWNHVKAGDRATTAILRKIEDPGWLDRQDAAGVAVLYGVLSDKILRLLAAFRTLDDRGARTDQPGEPERPGEDLQPQVE